MIESHNTIIDTHPHFGQHDAWDCPLAQLIALMDSQHTDKAVTGMLECNETTAAGFEKALRFTRAYEERLRLMLWIHPAVSGDASMAEKMLYRYKSQIACMKVHPQTARVPLDDQHYEPYLQLCQTY